MKPGKPLARRTPLQPGKPPKRKKQLARSTTPLPRQSAKAKKQQAVQGRAYAAAGDAEQCWCSACGKPGATDHSHHLSQGQHQQHRNDERNWLKLCRACHECFENNRRVFAGRFPDTWQRILASIAALGPRSLAAFQLHYDF